MILLQSKLCLFFYKKDKIIQNTVSIHENNKNTVFFNAS